MIYRGFDKLTTEMQVRVGRFLEELGKRNIKYVVVETFRDQAVQDAYYASGRKPLKEVNDLRKKAGLYLYKTEAENKVITQTTHSKHSEGKAIDIAPADADGGIDWKASEDRWAEIAVIGKACGLHWGGDWKGAWDKPHFEV